MDRQGVLVVVVVFIGASMAVVAAADVASPLVRMVAGAISAGCGAVLALLRPPGQQPPNLRPPFGGTGRG